MCNTFWPALYDYSCTPCTTNIFLGVLLPIVLLCTLTFYHLAKHNFCWPLSSILPLKISPQEEDMYLYPTKKRYTDHSPIIDQLVIYTACLLIQHQYYCPWHAQSSFFFPRPEYKKKWEIFITTIWLIKRCTFSTLLSLAVLVLTFFCYIYSNSGPKMWPANTDSKHL